MELGQIKIDLNKILDKKHEDNCNLIGIEIEIEYGDAIVWILLDSEIPIDSLTKTVTIHDAFILFPDFETEISQNYINEIEKYLKL